MNALEIKNLNKKYEGFELKNVSFTVEEGTVMGLIGENGAGKTTIIKAILNILTNYKGEILIFEADNKKNLNIYEDVGVVLDDMFFPEILYVKDINSIMKDIFTKWDSKLFFQYLEMFKLPLNKQIKTLSKGMRKKLEIITALAHHPKLLILDEPTTGIDPIARSEVIDLFRNFMQDEKCSILLSSHITTDLEHIADYITFIDKGEVVLADSCPLLMDNYGIVKCNEKEFQKIAKDDYLKYKKNKYDYEVLISNKKEFKKKYDIKIIDNITLEELMVLMIKGGK